jgi:MFS family permease
MGVLVYTVSMHIDQEPVVGADTLVESDPASGAIDAPSENGAVAAPRPLSDEPPTTNTAAGGSMESGWRNTFSSLGNRDFRLLWSGTLFMMGGFQMGMIAQGFLVYDMTGSAKILGLVSAGWAVPMLSLTLFGGALADRLERKPIIQGGQAVSAVVALAVAVSITTGVLEWPHLLVASMFNGVMFAFVGPARQAIIPQIVGQDRISNAIALNSAAMSSMSLVAPAIAGVLYATIGPEGVYYVMVGMWVIAVSLTTAIHKSAKMAARAKSAIIKDIKAGLSYVAHNRLILVLLGVMLATVVLSTPFQSLLPVFVVDVYGLESEAFGLLVSMIGLGSLVGSLGIAAIGRWRRGLLVILGGFMASFALMLVAVIPIYSVAVGVMVLVGLGNIAPMALITALIMERSDEHYRGRMMSIIMLMWGLMPLGVMPLGVAVDAIGGRQTIGFMSMSLLVVFSVVLLTQKRLRELQ